MSRSVGEASSAEQPISARIERVVYGGLGLVRGSATKPNPLGAVSFVPFTLAGELVEAAAREHSDELTLLRVFESSTERVEPGCPHFGVCGGCHLQMASYAEQLRVKRNVLEESLQRAGMLDVPEIATHAAEPWGYRNRIRLHVLRQDAALRLGYRQRESKDILAIETCPIAAPLLWCAAEAMLAMSSDNDDMRRWLSASDEIELFCDEAMTQLQISFLCSGEQASMPRGSFERAMQEMKKAQPALVGAGAVRVHPRTASVQEELAAWGAAGLSYAVSGERYWVARGGFFQVNRFLLPTIVELVCNGRAGALAWDLFAGVGLFARILARGFERVTAVEANPTAVRELAAALRRAGPEHTAVNAVTVEFLRRAVVERDRPELVVLDPPRAGAGLEACDLLARIAPAEMVYVSCDPVTLGRDLAVLQPAGYDIVELHLVDLFPQTYHQEAVVKLRRRS